MKVQRVQGVKPFIFSRAINMGIAAAGDSGVIICNDDTRLLSDLGFGLLSVIANENPQYGIISAGITGAVGNTEQIAQAGTRLRTAKHHTIVFVCVYIRRAVLDILDVNKDGHWLDEDYVTYAYDDDQACAQVRQAKLKLEYSTVASWSMASCLVLFRSGKSPDLGRAWRSS
jgi:GT2 family glycosyltransferase